MVVDNRVYRTGTGPQRNCLKEPVLVPNVTALLKAAPDFNLVSRFSVAQWFRMLSVDGGC